MLGKSCTTLLRLFFAVLRVIQPVAVVNAMFAAKHLGTACQPSCTAWLTYLPGGRNALLLLASMPCNCALLLRCIAPIPAASDTAVLERTDFVLAAADVAVSLGCRWAS